MSSIGTRHNLKPLRRRRIKRFWLTKVLESHIQVRNEGVYSAHYKIIQHQNKNT